MTTLAQAYSMAHTAFTQKNFAQAESICGQILSQLPEHSETLYLLGHIRKEQRQIESARTIFETLQKQAPENPELLLSLGTLEEQVGRYSSALEYCEKALKIAPDNGSAQFLYCSMLEKTNQLDKAEKYLEDVIQDSSSSEMRSLHATILRRRKKYEKAIEILNAINDNEAPEKVAQKYFELGQCHDKEKRFDKAFECFTTAHKHRKKFLKLGAVDIQKTQFLDDVKTFRKVFTGKKTKPSNIEQDINIHFMVGFPRSGTTLLHQMLNAHPDVEVTSEVPLIRYIYGKALDHLSGKAEELHTLKNDDLKTLQGLYIKFLKEYLEKYPGHEPFSEDRVYIDKMPLNMIFAGFIQKVFPKAKFILSLRHPCDSAISNFMQNFMATPAMENMTNLDDISHLYKQVFDLFFDMQDDLNFDVCQVRYEDLIQNYETETQKICEFLGLKYSKDIKNYRKKIMEQPSNINTPSYQQVTQPLYKDSKQRWKNYEKYFEGTAENFAPYIEKFGYAEK